MNALVTALWRGAAAGAAGTTTLDLVTYADMVARGRPGSSTPKDTVAALEGRVPGRIPGSDDERQSRLSALGAVMGIAAGVGTGAALGFARAAGLPRGRLLGALLASVGAMLGSNAPMVALGVTDPRTWSARSWASDAIPHLAYGVVTEAVLDQLDR